MPAAAFGPGTIFAASIHFYYVEIIRHIDRSGKILPGFLLIVHFALSHVLVLCMIEDQLLHLQVRSGLSGFLYRAVVLLIGLEAIPVSIEAEGLR